MKRIVLSLFGIVSFAHAMHQKSHNPSGVFVPKAFAEQQIAKHTIEAEYYRKQMEEFIAARNDDNHYATQEGMNNAYKAMVQAKSLKHCWQMQLDVLKAEKPKAEASDCSCGYH